MINPLPDDKILVLSKMKASADDRLNVNENIKFVFNTVFVKTNFPSGVFSPLIYVEASEKSSRWLWKESCVSTGV